MSHNEPHSIGESTEYENREYTFPMSRTEGPTPDPRLGNQSAPAVLPAEQKLNYAALQERLLQMERMIQAQDDRGNQLERLLLHKEEELQAKDEELQLIKLKLQVHSTPIRSSLGNKDDEIKKMME